MLQLGSSAQYVCDDPGTTPWVPASSIFDIVQRAGLHPDLAAVERLMMECAASRSMLLARAGSHAVAAGGKRLRAALVLLAARLGIYDGERALRPAAAVELLHTASLIHDDLVDHATRRRSNVTVHTQWGNNVALMLGDSFFALAAHILAPEPDPRVIGFYAAAAQTVVEGELSPVTQLEPLDVALAQYRYKIGCKTAALFEAACKAGMTVSGGDDTQIAALGRFGYDLGLAFQIVDDVLDFTSDELTLGKPAGNDLREGTLTLPLIYALDQSGSPLLRQVAEASRIEPESVPQIVATVIDVGGTRRAMDEAHAAIARAQHAIAIFPPSPITQACKEICTFVLERHM